MPTYLAGIPVFRLMTTDEDAAPAALVESMENHGDTEYPETSMPSILRDPRASVVDSISSEITCARRPPIG